MKPFTATLVVAALALAAPSAHGAVERIEIASRALVAGGRAFGEAGPYEVLTGRLHYAIDPERPANAAIVDLRHAPTDETGRVRFAGDFMLLKPVDLSRGNHRLLYEVNNRGNLLLLSLFNDAPWTNRPRRAEHLGTGFLLERGYTVLWSAWNWDVLPGSGRVLEVASGSGEHALWFAQHLRPLIWQPSDPDPACRRSIAAHGARAGLKTLEAPLDLDAAAARWPPSKCGATSSMKRCICSLTRSCGLLPTLK